MWSSCHVMSLSQWQSYTDMSLCQNWKYPSLKAIERFLRAVLLITYIKVICFCIWWYRFKFTKHPDMKNHFWIVLDLTENGRNNLKIIKSITVFREQFCIIYYIGWFIYFKRLESCPWCVWRERGEGVGRLRAVLLLYRENRPDNECRPYSGLYVRNKVKLYESSAMVDRASTWKTLHL